MKETIKEKLVSISENDYKKFSSALLPGVEHVLGVRLPILREMAKTIAKEDWRGELKESKDTKDIYFEEIMLRGMIIGYAKTHIEETLDYVTQFIPKINNWSVCDSFCTSLKIIQKHREQVWDYLQPYLLSNQEFEIRFGLIILLNHFLKCDENGKTIPRKRTVTMEHVLDETERPGHYTERILQTLNRDFSQGYYAQMAAAWTLAELFCTFPNHTLKIITNSKMDKFTYRKSIQKICESRIPTDEVKSYLRGI